MSVSSEAAGRLWTASWAAMLTCHKTDVVRATPMRTAAVGAPNRRATTEVRQWPRRATMTRVTPPKSRPSRVTLVPIGVGTSQVRTTITR